jgi:hypothetical protein
MILKRGEENTFLQISRDQCAKTTAVLRTSAPNGIKSGVHKDMIGVYKILKIKYKASSIIPLTGQNCIN